MINHLHSPSGALVCPAGAESLRTGGKLHHTRNNLGAIAHPDQTGWCGAAYLLTRSGFPPAFCACWTDEQSESVQQYIRKYWFERDQSQAQCYWVMQLLTKLACAGGYRTRQPTAPSRRRQVEKARISSNERLLRSLGGLCRRWGLSALETAPRQARPRCRSP